MSIRRVTTRAAVLLACVVLSSCAGGLARGRPVTADAPGTWPRPRRDRQLTAIQPLAGRMAAAPVTVAEYDLGRTRPGCTPAGVREGVGDLSLCVVAGALHAFDGAGVERWRLHPPGLNFASLVAVTDLDGDGRREAVLQAGRPTQPYGAAVAVDLERGQVVWRYDVEPMSYAWYLYVDDYLPAAAGRQVVVVMHGYPPDADNGYIALFEAGGGEAFLRQRWRYDFDAYTCFPALLRSDVDGDGVRELCVVTHSRMWVLDPRSGAVDQFLGWDVAPANVRSYGLTRFLDLDGDGAEDFLCIANFAQHHEVLLNRDGRLQPAWAHGWDESVTTGDVASNWPEPPVADVDGDGRLEVVVSMYNSEEESAWLVRIYDAVTGALKYRIPGATAVALADLDDDGRVEIVAGRTVDPTGKVIDAAAVYGFDGAGFVERWRLDGAEPVRAAGAARVRHAGAEALLVATGDGYALVPAPVGVAAPPAPVPAIAAAAPPTLLAADLDGDGRAELLVYRGGTATVLTWTGDGLAVTGEYASSGLPAIADLDGDGRLEIVTGAVDAQQPPSLQAWRPGPEPRLLWSRQLPTVDGPALPYGHPLYLQSGRFTGRAGDDVYVWAGVPRVRSAVLRGDTGALVWERGKVDGIERYWGPGVNVAASVDVDGDGAEDLVCTIPDYYCVLSGVDGTALHGPAFPPRIFDQPSQGLYSFPAVLERPGATPLVVLAGAHYFVGVMTPEAEGLWHRIPTPGENRAADEGFVRAADGRWLMGFGRQNGKLACVDVETGALRWELDLRATASAVIGLDVDGGGRQAFVFATSHGHLWAVADDGGRPRVLWRADLPAGGQTVIAADVDGDGASELVVTTADGFVRVLR